MMAGGEIYHLGRWRSIFVEGVFKPAIISAGLFCFAWCRLCIPFRSYEAEQLHLEALKTSDELWKCPVMRWKIGLFSYSLACFCDADNAYFVFLRRYVMRLARLWGVKHD